MTRDQELWGMASMLLRQHGELAPLRVAARIGELAALGEMNGVTLWREVALRLDALMAQAHKA
ncbi:DUF6961 family protein [Sphingobium sp. TKS]|uniref:DUF6961 family protein n=1 Tax=Sphingobium sp. TKS TaxID=1315974 RepID=UPI00082BA353|nr:hypothetical protein [Sphingobium sp. TKS]